MSMQDLDEAFLLIEKHFDEDEIRKSSGAKEKLIKNAEDYLDLSFSETYKNFLKRFGFINLGGAEVYGIIDEDFINSSVPDAIWLTSENRKDFNLPHHIIPIYDIGNGDTYALDTSQMNAEGECPVVVWPIGGYEQTPVLEIVAEDFGAFFLDMVKQQIAYKNSTD